MRYLRPIALALLLLGACACDKPTPAAANAATLAPSDPKLARLYAQTCKACHAAQGSGAPLAGDTAAWAPRLAQGEKTLLDHAINGYKGMPPMGGCSDCSEKDFAALIRFMGSS